MNEPITTDPPICLVRGNGIICRLYNMPERREWIRARQMRRYREGVQSAFAYYDSNGLAKIELDRLARANLLPPIFGRRSWREVD